MERGRNTDNDVPLKDKTRAKHRRRNLAVKALFDQGDYKGAFALKAEDARKKYKRQRMRVSDVNDYEEYD